MSFKIPKCYENACNIDYYFLGFWGISRISKNAMFILDQNVDVYVTKYLKRLIELIEINEWDGARTLRFSMQMKHQLEV